MLLSSSYNSLFKLLCKNFLHILIFVLNKNEIVIASVKNSIYG